MKEISLQHVIDLMTEYNAINAISGYEGPVADALVKNLEGCFDSTRRDALGNCICLKKGSENGKKILLTAHMDEIGFLVCDITPEGMVTLLPVGFHNPAMLTNQVFSIYTRANGTVYGVIAGGKPPHLAGAQEAPHSVGELRIDVGCFSPEEVKAKGVRVGDPVNIDKPGRMLSETVFSGKAVDNRSGVVALTLAMELLADEKLDVNVYGCGTVQEELGLKGAKVLAQGINPDYAVTVDVCFAHEGSPDELNPVATRMEMGKGPGIQMFDWNTSHCTGIIVLPEMVHRLEDAAEHAGVPCQPLINVNGGTDACEMSLTNSGVLTGSISLPERYIHTTIGTVDVRDILAAGKMLAQFVLDLNAEQK